MNQGAANLFNQNFVEIGKEIFLQDTPLGRGGEGEVFEVVQPYSFRDYVVKVYHSQERTPNREAKIRYMIGHPPELQDELSIIWPQVVVYQEGVFVGFMMRRARGEHDLTILSSLKLSARLSSDWNRKFSRETEEGLNNRIKLCHNIAVVLQQLHQTGKYVLVDIKPENIKISLNGYISIIDLDSLEIIDRQNLLFSAQKLSAEYCPTEVKHLNFKSELIPETWDRFSMAVVFYKILFGIHPFAVTGAEPYKNLVSHEQKIQAGLFPHGSRANLIEVMPFPHENFKALPKNLQNLFLKSFDEGLYRPPLRPSTQDWIEHLQDAVINVQKYQSPFALRKRMHQDKFIFEIEKGTYHQVGSEWAWSSFLVFQLFNEVIIDNPYLGIPVVGGLVFVVANSYKYTQQIEFDLDEKILYIKYKNYFGMESSKKVKLDKLQATLSKNGKVLKLYKKIYGGRKEVAVIKLDKEGKNEKIIRVLKDGLERLNIQVTEPGIMPI
ncbi:MAG: hypothetical protein NW226_23005 [Microscillaceae bacterium]|nr:hypothetical protein [Microscillaceae bacterium]